MYWQLLHSVLCCVGHVTHGNTYHRREHIFPPTFPILCYFSPVSSNSHLLQVFLFSFYVADQWPPCDVMLSVCRLSDALFRADLSATVRVQSGAAERWKQARRDNVLVLWSVAVLHRAPGRHQLQEIASLFSHKRGDEDTWPLALLLAGYARRPISRTRTVWLCDWSWSTTLKTCRYF